MAAVEADVAGLSAGGERRAAAAEAIRSRSPWITSAGSCAAVPPDGAPEIRPSQRDAVAAGSVGIPGSAASESRSPAGRGISG